MTDWQEYKVEITSTAKAQLKDLAKKLGRPLFAQVKSAILDLAQNPEGKTQQLYGKLAKYRSLHVARCRIIVQIDGVTVRVRVVAAGWRASGDRKDVYEALTRLIETGHDPEESDVDEPTDL